MCTTTMLLLTLLHLCRNFWPILSQLSSLTHYIPQLFYPGPLSVFQNSELTPKGRFHDLSMIGEQSQATHSVFQTEDIHGCSQQWHSQWAHCIKLQGHFFEWEQHVIASKCCYHWKRVMPGNFLIMLCTLRNNLHSSRQISYTAVQISEHYSFG